MKNLLVLLLIVGLNNVTLAQENRNISVMSAERVNVVYRGVPNTIKIAVPGARKFTATAPGMQQLDSIGNYRLHPGGGKEVIVKIEAVMQDGKILQEEKAFRILGLPAPTATLYGVEGYTMLTKQKLIDAVVEFEMADFLFDIHLEVYGFTLFLPDGQKIVVEGNKFNDEAIKAINKLRVGKEVIIDAIRYIKNPDPATCYRRVTPIIVEIVK